MTAAQRSAPRLRTPAEYEDWYYNEATDEEYERAATPEEYKAEYRAAQQEAARAQQRQPQGERRSAPGLARAAAARGQERAQAKPKAQGGVAMFLGLAGMWLAVIAFGGILWAINGGYSVIGLGVVARSFNSAGELFWDLATTIQFTLPVRGGVQLPLVPWIGVLASSCLQISIIWLKLSGRPIPVWLIASASAASIYDYGTTLFGLGTVQWIANIGILAQIVIAIPLTFALEFMVGYALRGGKR